MTASAIALGSPGLARSGLRVSPDPALRGSNQIGFQEKRSRPMSAMHRRALAARAAEELRPASPDIAGFTGSRGRQAAASLRAGCAHRPPCTGRPGEAVLAVRAGCRGRTLRHRCASPCTVAGGLRQPVRRHWPRLASEFRCPARRAWEAPASPRWWKAFRTIGRASRDDGGLHDRRSYRAGRPPPHVNRAWYSRLGCRVRLLGVRRKRRSAVAHGRYRS